jgi:hypothetical protein
MKKECVHYLVNLIIKKLNPKIILENNQPEPIWKCFSPASCPNSTLGYRFPNQKYKLIRPLSNFILLKIVFIILL